MQNPAARQSRCKNLLVLNQNAQPCWRSIGMQNRASSQSFPAQQSLHNMGGERCSPTAAPAQVSVRAHACTNIPQPPHDHMCQLPMLVACSCCAPEKCNTDTPFDMEHHI